MGGISPLEYLLSVMRDEDLPRDERVDAAKAAAPYLHARLNATTIAGDQEKPLRHVYSWEDPTD